ncbi:MAG: type II toxin-antitoxin system RelE/ParE family toxin [Endomicrobia bacterium]|nr:type II toxin-antitoxin system RelE/ParE family toxin [Endomicrobiia bacterium]
MDKIEKELRTNPYSGKKLVGIYKEMYSLRIGDYRVVYTFYKDGILILRIAHRREVYR